MCFRQASNDQTKNAIGWFFMLVIPLVRVFLKNHIFFCVGVVTSIKWKRNRTSTYAHCFVEIKFILSLI